jgi:hypothetical protein
MKRVRYYGYVGTVAGLLLTCGCMTRLCRYDVRISADPDLANASGKYPPVEVHAVVLNPTDSKVMASRSVTKYWEQGRRPDIYENRKRRLFFGEEKGIDHTISYRDAMWTSANRIEEPWLWLSADLPGMYQDQAEDPRRLSVPLARTRWWYRRLHHLNIGLSRGGLYVRPPDAAQARADEP